MGYAFPVLWGDDCNRVWDLRRAGQGLMNNVQGDAKPREIVEDTAVAVDDLPAYIAEFDALMRDKYGLSCVYYAHAGAGELHTRPLFNLKTPEGLVMFRSIATDIAALVKKYRGSLSGEHGDGRLRGEFIRLMVGERCEHLVTQHPPDRGYATCHIYQVGPGPVHIAQNIRATAAAIITTVSHPRILETRPLTLDFTIFRLLHINIRTIRRGTATTPFNTAE